MPGVDFNVLRNEITMEDVLKELRFQPTSRSGSQLHGPCPVHGGASPGSRTFSVNLAQGRYYCHKCHSRGNQLELWAAVHKRSLYDAAVDLCRALAREVPWIHRWRCPIPIGTTEKRHRYSELPGNVTVPNNLKHPECP